MNAVGEGSLSSVVDIIAATVPDNPSPAPAKVTSSSSHIEISWTVPYNGGIDLIGYKVYMDGATKDPELYTLVTDTNPT